MGPLRPPYSDDLAFELNVVLAVIDPDSTTSGDVVEAAHAWRHRQATR